MTAVPPSTVTSVADGDDAPATPPRHPPARGGAVPPRWNGGGIEKGLTSPPPVISHARATPLCLRSAERRVGSRLRRMLAPRMGGMAPPAASARDPLTAFRASRITTIAVVSSSTSRWWVRRASSALTSFSFASSRSATVRLVSIASVRVPRRWGVVHIAADPPVDPPEPDAARLRGPALALRRRFGRRDAGSREEDPDCAEDHDQRADRSAVHPTIISRCSQLVQIYPTRRARGRAQVLVLEACVRGADPALA